MQSTDLIELHYSRKPNGQYHLPHEREAILEFMRDLSVRKVPGVGRINERLLDTIGVKVILSISHTNVRAHHLEDMRGHFSASSDSLSYG